MAEATPRPDPTVETVHSWRLLMTVVAASLHVSVGLVTRVVGDGNLEYVAPSLNPENPYSAGEFIVLEAGVLCEDVINRRTELAVCDARTEAEWAENPDARTGLLAYLGFPVFWPDGEVFGTICVLDRRPRDFSTQERSLILSARDLIHDSLAASADRPPPEARATADGTGIRPTGDEPLGLWDHDPTTGAVRLSPLMAQLYTERAGEAVETLEQWLRCFPRRYADEWAARLRALAAGEVRTASIGALLPGHGGPHMVRMLGRGLRDSQGGLLSVVGLHTVQEIDPAEALVHPDSATALLDERGRVVQADVRLRELFGAGASVDELSERLDRAVVGGDLRGVVGRAVRGTGEAEYVVLEPTARRSPYLASIVQTASEGHRLRLQLRVHTEDPARQRGNGHLDRDPVTGLPTRGHLTTRLRGWSEGPDDYPGQVALALIDVTNIRAIAQSEGLRTADEVLVELADRLTGTGHFVAALGYGYLALLAQLHESVDVASFRKRVQRLARLEPAGAVEPVVEVAWTDVSRRLDRPPEEVLDQVAEGLDDGADDDSPRLTERQREIAQLVAAGLSNKEIAEHLVIAVRTVEGHLEAIRERLDLRNRAQLVAFVLTHPRVCGTPADPGDPRRGEEAMAARG